MYGGRDIVATSSTSAMPATAAITPITKPSTRTPKPMTGITQRTHAFIGARPITIPATSVTSRALSR